MVDPTSCHEGLITKKILLLFNGRQKGSTLRHLKRVVQTQRSIFSSKSLSERIPRILNNIFSDTRNSKADSSSKNASLKISDSTKCQDIGGNTMTITVGNVPNCLIKMTNLLLVRVAPIIMKLLRRVQRFEQV